MLDTANTEVMGLAGRALVSQVLRNLISNAAKYTNRGEVLLRCSADGERARIDVQDTGIGMSPEELSRIYEEFYQVSVPANASREGYGLGLSIVSRIVKLLDLKLTVRSQPGEGSVFSFFLPLAKAPLTRQEIPVEPSQAAAREGVHVLLVEDDPGVRNATRLLLKSEGYRVTVAASLAEAIERATENADIKLLISDYHIGRDETGVQVVSSVREIIAADLKAVLINGDTSPKMRGLYRVGDVRIVNKPINADELLGVLTTLLA
jgi:CheY-like chemotaxis protein